MDYRRLDTMGAIRDGVLLRQAPKTDMPEGREQVDPRVFDDDGGGWPSVPAADVVVALDRGALLYVAEYYGCVSAWRTDDGRYRGTLMQYKNLTEDRTFRTAKSCAIWFKQTVEAVAG
jgi:hypothetical protein